MWTLWIIESSNLEFLFFFKSLGWPTNSKRIIIKCFNIDCSRWCWNGATNSSNPSAQRHKQKYPPGRPPVTSEELIFRRSWEHPTHAISAVPSPVNHHGKLKPSSRRGRRHVQHGNLIPWCKTKARIADEDLVISIINHVSGNKQMLHRLVLRARAARRGPPLRCEPRDDRDSWCWSPDRAWIVVVD